MCFTVYTCSLELQLSVFSEYIERTIKTKYFSFFFFFTQTQHLTTFHISRHQSIIEIIVNKSHHALLFGVMALLLFSLWAKLLSKTGGKEDFTVHMTAVIIVNKIQDYNNISIVCSSNRYTLGLGNKSYFNQHRVIKNDNDHMVCFNRYADPEHRIHVLWSS